MNRKNILAESLEAIIATTRDEAELEGVQIFVTDNGSTDGTPEFLRQMELEGKLNAWCMAENLGTEVGRNVYWQHCQGAYTVRIDDKVKPLVPGWLKSMRRLSDLHKNALVAVPYDPTVMFLHDVAPCISYLRWDNDQGQGGPLILIPPPVIDALGACDEIPGLVYGWGDCLYIKRAALLGYEFGFSLRSPVEFLTSASPEARAKAMEFHSVYVERLREYQEAERDVFIPIDSTRGYAMGLEARG